MYGVQCPQTKLWLVPLSNKKWAQTPSTSIPLQQHYINNIHHISNQSDLITYLHKCLFSPNKATLIKAIKNDQFLGIPGMIVDAVQHHLPDSTATIKGHMHRTPKNV